MIENQRDTSQEELQELRRTRLKELVDGEHHDTFSEWILRGTLHEPYHPSVAVAFFPQHDPKNPEQVGFAPQYGTYTDQHQPIPAYWKQVQKLHLPQRATEYEQRYFRQLAKAGDQLWQQFLPNLLAYNMPAGLIVFSRPNEKVVLPQTESAYFFCPTVIPPTATFRHFQLLARQEIGRLSSTM